MKATSVLFMSAALCLAACSDAFDKGISAYKAGDYESAMKVFAPLAEKGDARAKLELGLMYAYGLGVKRDLGKGIALVEDAAKSGNADAQYYIEGFFDGDGNGALGRWYRKAAEKGLREAQFLLGDCYGPESESCGVIQDYKQSAQWYKKAADQGLIDAQMSLGGLYYTGKGVPISNAVAIEWFTKAAEQGSASGQYMAGLAYCESSCATRNSNSQLSYMLLSLAAADNVDGAADFRDEVGSVLSPEEVSQAQAAAAKWKPGSPFPSLKVNMNSHSKNMSGKSDAAKGKLVEQSTLGREIFEKLKTDSGDRRAFYIGNMLVIYTPDPLGEKDQCIINLFANDITPRSMQHPPMEYISYNMTKDSAALAVPAITGIAPRLKAGSSGAVVTLRSHISSPMKMWVAPNGSSEYDTLITSMLTASEVIVDFGTDAVTRYTYNFSLKHYKDGLSAIQLLCN